MTAVHGKPRNAAVRVFPRSGTAQRRDRHLVAADVDREPLEARLAVDVPLLERQGEAETRVHARRARQDVVVAVRRIDELRVEVDVRRL